MEGLDRIKEEFRDLKNHPIGNCGITVGLPDENDYRKWRVSLSGPKDTSYNGGLFFLSVTFPEDYPERPPEICFLTPIYHFNVNPYAPISPESVPLGHISISTLFRWKSDYTMRKVLVDIFALLYLGNPNSTYYSGIGDEFKNNRKFFEEKIKYFTKKYAHPKKSMNYPPRDKDWDFSL